ncbi:uncharacterized protein LY89DRAFT_574266 [Mollisia scopiformis]|uniref:Actin-like ATPase domain-containing protein n=1 Tax=Mollisia scopiformis TaxID=149040 RepID=A0A194XSF6_MOLSC|nr:uncharacterized protein LY89DRAFT_574266 [Mollisia scopiformis]KUJ23235.1 hypothetical protein LY89DRAFT_574266 [Mollisia scopiformis]
MSKKLVIGLDFGTTFSGVAFCDDVAGAKGTANVQLIQSWPGLASMANTEKVPSRIAYGLPPNSTILWGNLIKPNTKAKVYVMMKLRLDERLNKSNQLRRLLELLSIDGLGFNDSDEDEDGPPEYPGKEPVDVVADYLTEIRKHVFSDLAKIYGSTLSTLNKELVITVPAVWSEHAKDLTVKAVAKAKFDVSKISLVTEPEAAAIYTLKDMKEGAGKDQIQITPSIPSNNISKLRLQVGDSFVLSDAGGGTVDLISYHVTQVHPVLKVEEAAIGSGDKCGASYVDKEFLTWLEKKLGSEAFRKIPQAKTRHGSVLMTAFETAKMYFEGKPEEFEVPLPKERGIEDDEKGIEDQYPGMLRLLILDSSDLIAIFDPCVNRILELIDGQVAAVLKSGNRKPKARALITLDNVGGFGRNEYLYSKIVEYCKDRNMLTSRPSFPWSAVARGAVCRGLEGPQAGLVAVRLARKHYGTYASERFNPRKHLAQDMYTDQYEGTKYARGQMTWLVSKGERLPDLTPRTASISCGCQFRTGEDRSFAAVLVGCDEDDAPQRYAHKDAYNICRVSANLNDVPDSKFPRCRSGLNSEEYMVAEFKLEATFADDRINWKVIFHGKEYGATSISYSS